MFVGNKCDLQSAKRVISREQGEKFVEDLSHGTAGYQETSAKSNINVEKVN